MYYLISLVVIDEKDDINDNNKLYLIIYLQDVFVITNTLVLYFHI